MAGRKSDFTLTKLDDLFSTQEQRDEEKLSKIRDIPLTEIDDFPDHPFKVRDDEDMAQLIESKVQLENAKAESQKPFPHEEELKTKSARLAELNTLLDMDKKDNELVDGERVDDAEEPDRSNSRDAR